MLLSSRFIGILQRFIKLIYFTVRNISTLNLIDVFNVRFIHKYLFHWCLLWRYCFSCSIWIKSISWWLSFRILLLNVRFIWLRRVDLFIRLGLIVSVIAVRFIREITFIVVSLSIVAGIRIGVGGIFIFVIPRISLRRRGISRIIFFMLWMSVTVEFVELVAAVTIIIGSRRWRSVFISFEK